MFWKWTLTGPLQGNVCNYETQCLQMWICKIGHFWHHKLYYSIFEAVSYLKKHIKWCNEQKHYICNVKDILIILKIIYSSFILIKKRTWSKIIVIWVQHKYQTKKIKSIENFISRATQKPDAVCNLTSYGSAPSLAVEACAGRVTSCDVRACVTEHHDSNCYGNLTHRKIFIKIIRLNKYILLYRSHKLQYG